MWKGTCSPWSTGRGRGAVEYVMSVGVTECNIGIGSLGVLWDVLKVNRGDVSIHVASG